MAEYDKTEATASFHQEADHNEEHDDRDVPVSYADPSRECDNIYYEKNMTKEEAFIYLFENSINEYNDSQPRKDRQYLTEKIDENGKKQTVGGGAAYLDMLLEKKAEQDLKIKQMQREGKTVKQISRAKKAVMPSYQFIITIGSKAVNPEFNAVNGPRKYEIRDLLEKYMNEFQERNPNAFLYNAPIHMDEAGQPHLHGSVVFFAEGCFKNGPKRQCSQKQALKAMGFESDTKKNEEGKYELAITKWQNAEREYIHELMKEHDIEWKKGKGSKEHLSRSAYIAQAKEEVAKEEQAKAKEEQAKAQEEQLQAELSKHDAEVERQALAREKSEFEDIVKNTDSGKTYQLHKENTEHKKQNEYQMELFSRYWNEYKDANSWLWDNYRPIKNELMDLVKQGRQGIKIDKRRVSELLYDVSDRSQFFLVRLVKLIAAICMQIKVRFLEKEQERLEKANQRLKALAKEMVRESQNMSEALKSKDLDRVENAINEWNSAIMSLDSSIEFCLSASPAEIQKIEREKEMEYREEQRKEQEKNDEEIY